MNSRERALLRDQRGMTLAFVALLLFVFLGVAALAVDLGMLMAARTEAQRVADSAALAGAGVLTGATNDEAVAKERAQHFASLNNIRKIAAEVDPDDDVDVELDNWLVRVRVLRTTERGNPMTNLFARAIGVDTTDVSAVAAARQSPTGGAKCMLPLVLPDRWWEGIAPATGDSQTGPWPVTGDTFDAAEDVYQPLFIFNEDGEIIEGPNEPHSSYNEFARGQEIRIKSNNPHETWSPSTYFPIRFPGQQPGAAPYRERICGCPDADLIWYPGQLVPREPGNMPQPTNEGFQCLIDLAHLHEWRESGPGVPEGGCVWDPNRPGSAGCIPAWASPRTRPMPMFDPGEYPPHAPEPFRVTAFAGVFVERVEGSGPHADIIARFVEYRGAEALPPGNDDVPVLGRILQLVE